MNELTSFSGILKLNKAVAAADAITIASLNTFTASRGLMLSDTAAREVAETRLRALRENSRIELGTGLIEKLILVFSMSRYAVPADWEELVHTLVESFYFVKTEAHDSVSDNELIKYMLDEFEGTCEGSIELLTQRIENYVRELNGGHTEETEDSDEE
ncbi:MAG: hypothetical protein IJ428_06825 [Clostridia bacterium]|nr:hypothetical protein [Clostridia bacterium]